MAQVKYNNWKPGGMIYSVFHPIMPPADTRGGPSAEALETV